MNTQNLFANAKLPEKKPATPYIKNGKFNTADVEKMEPRQFEFPDNAKPTNRMELIFKQGKEYTDDKGNKHPSVLIAMSVYDQVVTLAHDYPELNWVKVSATGNGINTKYTVVPTKPD